MYSGIAGIAGISVALGVIYVAIALLTGIGGTS